MGPPTDELDLTRAPGPPGGFRAADGFPPNGAAALPTDALAAIARANMEAEWDRGNPLPAGWYFQQVPALATGPSALDLIYLEYVLREEAGERPTDDEFAHRYPAHAGALLQLLGLDAALIGLDDQETAPPQAPGEYTQAYENTSALASADRPPSIGRYLVVESLGSGGQAEVFLGIHPGLGRQVVIKRLKAGGLDAPRATERLASEGRALASLDHPNLARVYDLEAAEGQIILVMELIRGRNLGEVGRHGLVAPADAARWTAAVSRAAAHAHARGVLHLDIKPRNVMLDETGKAVLIDFGLALVHSGLAPPETSTGVSGTLTYMAPEQARGEYDQLGPAADVYGLGGVLYYLLVGKNPITATDATEVYARARVGAWDREALRGAQAPAALVRICTRALDPDPAKRFPSAGAFADALEAAIRPRRWPWAVAAGMLAILVLAFAWGWISSTKSVDQTKTGPDTVDHAKSDPGPDPVNHAKTGPITIEQATSGLVAEQPNPAVATNGSTILLSGKPGSYKVNAGRLRGLTTGSILKILTPAAMGEQILGHVKATATRPTDSDVEPCAYNNTLAPERLPDGGRCRVVFVDYGEVQMQVAVAAHYPPPDPKPTLVPEDLRASLIARLKAELKPNTTFRLVDDPKTANWLIAPLPDGQISLIPAGGWGPDNGRRPPKGYGPVPTDGGMMVWLEDALGRIARADGLLRMATDRGQELLWGDDLAPKMKVELFLRDAKGLPTIRLPWPGADLTLYDMDRVMVQVTNTGRVAFDLTILNVDSDRAITPFFPLNSTSNRLSVKDTLGVPMRITATTGAEHLVLIAVKADGQEVNFLSLVQKSPDKLRDIGAREGGPLPRMAKLFDRRIFGASVTEQTRGATPETAADYAMALITWKTEKTIRPRPPGVK